MKIENARTIAPVDHLIRLLIGASHDSASSQEIATRSNR